MLTLERLGAHEWEFVYPKLYEELMDEFDRGIDEWEVGRLEEAERVFRRTLSFMPDHLDAFHHLALVFDERQRKAEAGALWTEAVRIGRRAFPAEFDRTRDRLEWSRLDNRPFLRCLHGLARHALDAGDIERACDLQRELLTVNPNDNQGVRAEHIGVLLELGRPADVLAVCSDYPDDILPETLYGGALALFQLGHRRDADLALRRAAGTLPHVVKELLKATHRRPAGLREDMVTVGSADEAYVYWQHHGRYWQDTDGALDWLRAIGHTRLSVVARRGRWTT